MTDQSVNKNIMPKVVDKQRKRAEIISAATGVFAGHGFQGASVEDIAVAAGVSKGTVYSYFKNKEALFFATFEAFQAQLADELVEALASEPTASDQLVKGMTTMAETLVAHIEVFPLTLEVWAAASSGPSRRKFASAMQGMYRQFREMSASLISAGKANGEFRDDVNEAAVAAWLIGGMDGLVLQAWFDSTIDVRACIEALLETILRGISVAQST